jgi:hypothetical protein
MALHLGNGWWTVVDSFLSPRTRRPIALEYIESLGASSEDVELIVATHWHDDHVQGMAALVERCTLARFVSSSAHLTAEFLEVVEHMDAPGRLPKPTPGAREYGRVLAVLEETGLERLHWAMQDMLLPRRDPEPLVELWALSPSTQTCLHAGRHMASILSDFVRAGTIAFSNPNPLSVVLWATAETGRALLGGDIDSGRNARMGWQGVLDAHSRRGRAGVYKVAHHGSHTGDHRRVWSEMLVGNPHAAITARTSNPALPTEMDRERIRSQTRRALLAGDATEELIVRSGGHQRLIAGQTTRGLRVRGKEFGQIRYRLDTTRPGASWQVASTPNVARP